MYEGGGGRRRAGEGSRDTESKTRTPHKVVGKNFPTGSRKHTSKSPTFFVTLGSKNKMKPTNPNAHTYVNGTDVKTHGYAVTHNTFLPFCNSLFEQSCTCFPCYQSAVWSGKCRVWSVECEVRSVECKVWSGECRVCKV